MSSSLFVIGTAALVWVAEMAGAQTSAASNAVTDLPKLLKPGEVLSVVDENGQRITGQLVNLSASTLTLHVLGRRQRRWLISDLPIPQEERQIALGGVTRIDRRDSMKEGAWAGFTVGLGLAVYTSRMCDPEDFCGALTLLSFGALIGGPVAGALIDHSITTPIYRAPAGRWTASVGVSPGLQRKGGAVGVQFAF